MVQPSDKVAALKEQIEAKTRYLVQWQGLFLVPGIWLDDSQTLATYNICKDSTLHLEVTPGKRLDDREPKAASSVRNDWTRDLKFKDEVIPCDIEIAVLPINRFVYLRIPNGLSTTIRELKDLVFQEEGILCDGFYLDENITDERLADTLTLAACGVPERTLVAVQSEIDFSSHGGGSPRHSRSEVKPGLLDVGFNEALNTNGTLPSLEDAEQQNSQRGEVSGIETAITTTAQTHRHCERELTVMTDEKNKLLTDLLELQTKYPKLLSDVLEEKNMLEQDLKELRSEFPRELSREIGEKNEVQQQLIEAQSEFHREVSKVLEENLALENELDALKITLGHEKEKSLCTICFDRPRDTLIFSCLHLQFCSSCLRKHEERTNKCPACRGVISWKLTYK